MEAEQYDISEKMKKLFDEKQKQRAAAKQFYMKLLYNPHRPHSDGYPFDPAIQRFTAMSIYRPEYFKPTTSTYAKYILFLLPIGALFCHTMYTVNKREELLRSGTVAYKDRDIKFLF